jgi:hypothetical protein
MCADLELVLKEVEKVFKQVAISVDVRVKEDLETSARQERRFWPRDPLCIANRH